MKDCRRRLCEAFPKSFYNGKDEFIAHGRSNTYLCFGNCENEREVQYKVLEWLSRAAAKGEPYRSQANNITFQKFMRQGINTFLGTNFTKDDMQLIYQCLGNCVKHSLTVRFVDSGYDMKILEEIFPAKRAHRMCRIFNCDAKHGNTCCHDCDQRKKCKNSCQNHPDLCHCVK